MKHLILLLLCILIVVCSSVSAEEPILVINTYGHSSKITDIMATPDGKTLISVSEDKTIRMWDVETSELLRTLRHQIGEGRNGKIFAGALSPDGKILAVGGFDERGERGTPVYLFDLGSGEVIQALTGHPDTINDLAFSSDGRLLASGSGAEIHIWEIVSDRAQPFLTLQSSSIVYSLAIAPDGKSMASGHTDGTLQLWQLPEESQGSAESTGLKPRKIIKKHSNTVACVAYSPDGRYLVSGDFDGNKFLWENKTGRMKKQLPLNDTLETAMFAPDGQSVLVNDGYDAVLFSVAKGRELLRFSKHQSPVRINAFSNSVTAATFLGNDLIATAGGNDYEIYIWNAETGDVNMHIMGQGQRVEFVAFGEHLEVAFGNTITEMHKERLLERSFNFFEMMVSHQLSESAIFLPQQTTYQKKALQYEFGKWYELRIKGEGIIKNRPKDGWVRSYAFTSDGAVVVGSSHVLRLHRTDGSAIREFIGHTGEVWDVAISRDGKLLASASDDQTLKLWNLATGECLATLFVARDREWICWTPQGYYAASAGGEKYIGWQVNQGLEQAALYYPASVFRKQLYYPELVKQTIRLGSFERARKVVPPQPPEPIQLQTRAESADAQTRSVILPPVIDWIEPTTETIETTAPSLRIHAKIRSNSSIENNQITEFKLLVNGRTQAASDDFQQNPYNSEFYKEFEYELPLTGEKNELTIFAATQHAGTVSDKRIVLSTGSAEDRLKPDLYMVSVGISDYPLNDMKLTYADNDAKAVTRVFLGQIGRLYREVHVKYLYDADATRINIISALEWLETKTKQGDVAIIFIAAHGVRGGKGNRYYILPVDGSPDSLRATGVDWGIFAEVLGNLPSQVLLLLDTCHSGQLGQDLAAVLAQRDNTEAIRILSSDEYGVVILAASTGGQVSQEQSEWGHGAFTAALLEALEQGLADFPPKPDSIIHLRELDLYVDARVRELTDDTQHPTTQKPSTISRFPIVQIAE